ncbi:MAG: ATP-binding protein, partial [Pseudomonadota bacterium]
RDLTELRQLQEQIVHAEKLATLGQLAAGVVHEINNPLTSISVYGEYLLRKHAESGSTDTEKLRRIVDGSERILRFTRDLMAYARPTVEAPRPLSIHQVLDQAVVFCEHELQRHGVVVKKSFGQQIPEVFGVRDQLHQVFINLVTNACHAVPKEGGVLTIATVADADHTVSVHMQDNGHGIAEDHVGRVFEPFFSTKGEGRGTGLGLSIVRRIIQHHRGEIDVQSSPTHGTTFSVTLPCTPDARTQSGADKT